MLVNDEDTISVSVANESNIATSATLRVIADVADGAVLYEETIDNLNKSDSKAMLLNLASLRNGANVDVFYITVTADKDEIAVINNQSIVYTALGTTAKNTLTIISTEGGRISGNSGGLYGEGDVIEIEAVAENGYHFTGWTSSNGGVFSDASKNSTTFEMPGNDATITAHFAKNSPDNGGYIPPSSDISTDDDPCVNFTDINRDLWYHEAIDYAIENSLMNGVGGDKFDPTGNLTRGMLCQIFYNKEGRPAVTAENPFTDVPADAWYANAVVWAYENKIVEGYGNGKFGPNDDITREQLATIIWRYDGKKASATSLDAFSDAGKISSYAVDALKWAYKNKVVSGKGNGILDPLGKAQRCEVAQMLMNYLKK